MQTSLCTARQDLTQTSSQGFFLSKRHGPRADRCEAQPEKFENLSNVFRLTLRPINLQEDLLDLITALLKFSCFPSTTVARSCTFFYNPAFIIYKFHRNITHAAVAQWSRRLPLNREVVSLNPVGD